MNLLIQAMQDPQRWVVSVRYVSRDGTATDRLISPIRFHRPGYVLALCVGRGEVRQFCLKRLTAKNLVSADQVLMPEGVSEVSGGHSGDTSAQER